MQDENALHDQNDMPENNASSVKLVLTTTRKLGFFKAIPCYVIFYDNELVLAHLSKQTEKDALQQFRQEQKEQGKGIFKTMFAMAGFWQNYGQRYYTTSKEDILQQDSMNMTLPYAGITSFLFKTARRDTNHTNQNPSHYAGKIVIKTATEKMTFQHQYFDTRQNIKTLLQSVLGAQLQYKAPLFSKTFQIGGNPGDID